MTNYYPRCIDWKVAPSATVKECKSYNKKNAMFHNLWWKNLGYRIRELICYCFLTNLGIKFIFHILNYHIKMYHWYNKEILFQFIPIWLVKETKLFELVTGTESNPWLSGNMLLNINTCLNWWLILSANLRVVVLNLLELTQFARTNQSIIIYFVRSSRWRHQEDSFSNEATWYHSTMLL